MKRYKGIFIGFVIIFAFLLRLYKFDSPLADWHSWRQVDTSAVSRNFVTGGFDVLHPQFDDLSNVASGKDNPHGYRFVEFPIYNIFQASLSKYIGILSLEQWGRFVTIIASIGSTVFIFLIAKNNANFLVGVLSAGTFALLPYNIYYGRTILPDSSMVMALLGGIYFFDKWLHTSHHRGQSISYYLLAMVFTSSAILLKPYALFFSLPFLYLLYKKYGYKSIFTWQAWLFLFLTVAPFVWWRMWMLHFPEGIPVNEWLFNKGDIRFKGAFFYWIFADRIGRLLLGYWGVALVIIGILVKKKGQGFFLSFLASSLSYITVMARGNVQHDYYQILIVPSLCFFVGFGLEFLISQKSIFYRKTSIVIAGVVCLFTGMFGWYNVRDYFNINNTNMIIASKELDRILPKNAKVIALYDGDTTFLYNLNRKGWASLEKPLPEMVAMGADYLVLVNPTPADYNFSKEYHLVSRSPIYLLYNLHQNQ